MHSTDKILTSHVGSLPRPADLRAMLAKQQHGEPVNAAAYDASLKSAVGDVVRQQTAAGIDIPNDGDFGKINWSIYIRERIAGVTRQEKPAAKRKLTHSVSRDRQQFAEFYTEYDKTLATPLKYEGWVANGPLTYRTDAVLRDIANLKAALGSKPGFMTAVAPTSALNDITDEYYGDEEKFLFAMADCLRVEYKAIVDAGFILQVDDPWLAGMQERMVPPMTNAEYHKWAGVRIEALNRALAGLPLERTRYHLCWGSWNGPHISDTPLADIVDLVLQVNTGGYSLENANPRHSHEWQVWKKVKLPPGKVLLPGVISHSTNIVEHPELVAERITRLANVVGRENVIASTDCGFAQNAFFSRVHPSIVQAKLAALGEGARIATKELWGRQAA
ncbi:MAG TPA: cobalamin-independent methionine synthase II family protein [Xanthobacteraceae bacterium]|jgi:5-methyltetrahydropteroyltriglutamate--homocysteine methyltransferase|nr:cobalamin-independent methionine synthase II family protein [Xanthobacteraceae bacterium]